jgi:Protein of unknown function (DUF2442)
MFRNGAARGLPHEAATYETARAPASKVSRKLRLLPIVTEVNAKAGYQLALRFRSGERRVFDMTPYLKKMPFAALAKPAAFQKAFVQHGTVMWPGGIDIAPETLYAKSSPT